MSTNPTPEELDAAALEHETIAQQLRLEAKQIRKEQQQPGENFTRISPPVTAADLRRKIDREASQ